MLTMKNKIVAMYFFLLIPAIIFSKYQIIPVSLVFCFLFYYFFICNDKIPNKINNSDGKKDKLDNDFKIARDDSSQNQNSLETIPLQLRKEYTQQITGKSRNELNETLGSSLDFLKELIPSCYTAAIFFVNKQNSFYLHFSHSESKKIIKKAVIEYGKGLVGYIAKENKGKEIFEGCINSNSKTLFYYNDDEGIRSFMGFPITFGGKLAGAIVFDSKKYNAFDQKLKTTLRNYSRQIAFLVKTSILNVENQIGLIKLSAFSSLQEEFFRKNTKQEVIDLLGHILKTAMDVERITISLLNKDNVSATICSVYGIDSSYYKGLKFSLEDKKCLATLVYKKNQTINREFLQKKYTPRFSVNEKENIKITSILAVPIPSSTGGRCIGAVTLESEFKNNFTHFEQDHLKNLTLSAGLAIDKITLLETQKQLAAYDGLTNLPNHRKFQNTFTSELKRASRYKESLSLIFADIDYFKKINDTYGHPVGDSILKQVASILKTSVREEVDLPARYGGEEFAILLVRTNINSAVETAERMRNIIEKTNFFIEGGIALNITMSLGVSAFPQDSDNKDMLIKKADNALYRAKAEGRNRVIRCN